MSERVSHIELSGMKDSTEVCITIVYADGHRQMQWMGFWRGLRFIVKALWRGFDVRDRFDA